MFNCDECGAILSGDEITCPGCGAPVEKAVAPLEEVAASAEQPAAGKEILCDECGAQLAAAEKVCHNCGAPVEEAAPAEQPVAEMKSFCEKCGTQLSATEDICYNCGTPVKLPAEYSSALKNSIAVTIANIIFILTIIPATIVFLGKMFEFSAAGIEVMKFGFFDFSAMISYINSIIGEIESFGVNFPDSVQFFVTVFSPTGIIIVVLLIANALMVIDGFKKVALNEMNKAACFTPLVYVIICLVFCFGAEIFLLNPVNEFVSDADFLGISQLLSIKAEIGLLQGFDILLLLAVINGVIFFIVNKMNKKQSSGN